MGKYYCQMVNRKHATYSSRDDGTETPVCVWELQAVTHSKQVVIPRIPEERMVHLVVVNFISTNTRQE